MWTGSLCRTNTGPEKLIIRGFKLCQGTRRMPADSTEVQNVITIHDQGNGISILNVWGSVCENRLFRAQILPLWFKSSYAWIECPGQWNLLRRDQARINPGLEQIQTLLPSAWLGLRNLTDERSSGDKPGLWLINKVLPTARVNQQSIAYSMDKMARAEELYWWVTKRGDARAWSGQPSISFCVDRLNR